MALLPVAWWINRFPASAKALGGPFGLLANIPRGPVRFG